jgi:hypothetical protein
LEPDINYVKMELDFVQVALHNIEVYLKESKVTSNSPPSDLPLMRLPPEDLALVQELVLQSGSLKGLAEVYDLSYPTIRGRLDKVIERLRGLIDGRKPDPLREYLATLIDRGGISVEAARRVLELSSGGDTKPSQGAKS